MIRFAVISLVLACAACAPSSTAVTLNTAALNANTAAVDRLVADLERQPSAQPAPAQQKPPAHVVCRDGKLQGVEQPAKGEHDLGALAACPAPNDAAPCVGGEPLSNVEARCRAGKP